MQTYEKGLKPKGTINPSGYRTVSNLEDELAKRQKNIAIMFGIVTLLFFLTQGTCRQYITILKNWFDYGGNRARELCFNGLILFQRSY